MMDRYQGRRPFHLPVFIEDYVATSWLPASSNTEVAGGLTPIYEDDQFMAFDRDVAGAEIFGLTWPDEYDRFKRPRPVF